MKAYFQTLEVDVQEGTALFHLLLGCVLVGCWDFITFWRLSVCSIFELKVSLLGLVQKSAKVRQRRW